MENFNIGNILYHKTNKTRCIITASSDKNITVKLENMISGKSEITLPKTHIGEWLFYVKEDVDLAINDLANINEYSCGRKVSEYIEGNRIEFEKQRELKRQREIQEQIKLQRKTKKDESIEEVLVSRNIVNLIHFTRIENLESILSIGLIPRNILEYSNIKYLKNDEHRLDGKSECTCFSVEFPNNLLFPKFREKYPNSRWVVIEIDAKLLLNHKESKYFCYHNAARSDISWKIGYGVLGRGEDFEEMFHEEDKYNTSLGSVTKCRSSIQGIKEYLPTSVQAEILLSGVISNSYIKSVYFNNNCDYKYFINTLSSKDIIKNFNFIINNAYFIKRENVVFPERRKISG